MHISGIMASNRRCGCSDHAINAKDSEFKIIDIRHKTVSKSTIQGLLGKRRVNFFVFNVH